MNRDESLTSLLTTQNIEISILGFLVNLILAVILAAIVGLVYVRFGTALSNRRMFARNLILLTLTTTLVITIVKSSLALSLGLVGALSIVRFRSAIKEPEELMYLFLAIGIGLGLGADQRALTLVALAVVVVFLVGRSQFTNDENGQNMHLTVSSDGKEPVSLPDVVAILRQHTRNLELKRFDQTSDAMEASFLVEFEDFEKLDASRVAVEKLGESVSISFVDNKGIS